MFQQDNMQKALLFFSFFLLNTFFCGAQFTRYIIRFTDKGNNSFTLGNPAQYLSQRALDRRARYNIPIDSTDLPITARYIDSVRLSGNVTILTGSKWLNQIAIQTSDAAALAKINSFPFVISADPIAARTTSILKTKEKYPEIPVMINAGNPSTGRPENINDYYNYGSSGGQVRLHKGDFLHNHGFRGEGMQMGILDAGFYHYKTLPTFDSLRMDNRVLGTWDFVSNDANVDEDHSHGMQCLSTIAANIPGTFVGTAPKTSFYLYRTEDIASEYPIEEQNLAAGAERADSIGVDLCSISLGYYSFDNPVFDYTYADMNGNTSISSRAADLAAKKGMLMVIAAGNEGNNSWHFLITPSDADSVLSVGAVDTTGLSAGFSSYGPSSDGQIKPNVAAVGWLAVVANTFNGLPSYGNGTSFACPNMAGISTCLWQAFPEISNMGIIDALQKSANRSGNPDNRTGYGIPDAKKAFVMLQKKLYTQQSSINNCFTDLQFSVKTDNTMSLVIERKTATDLIYSTINILQNSGAYGMHNFVYNDPLSNVSTGEIKYRIKMIISTDTTFFLDSLTVNHDVFCINNAENKIDIGPNPVEEDLNIYITRTTDAKIDIVMQNVLGQKIYSTGYQQSAGTLLKTIPMRKLSRGAYFISVYINNKKTLTKKIIRN